MRQRVEALEEHARGDAEWFEEFGSFVTNAGEGSMLSGHASDEGVDRFATDFGRGSRAFYRPAADVLISSLGIGTSRGAADSRTDVQYARAVHAALRGGINLIDTSINYRQQRSERAVNAGLRVFIETCPGARAGVVVCTKGGYLVPGALPDNTLRADDVVGGVHCILPAFLDDQIARSRRNLGLKTIDIYYLHNPEVQLRFINGRVFLDRIRAAFAFLEHAVGDGLIRYYGTATWDGYRTGALSLHELVDTARQIAGDDHHFRFVQLPFNLGMREALTRRAEGNGTVLEIAAELGVSVIASASLRHASQARALPSRSSEASPSLPTDAQRAIQFVRATAGIASALVGMRRTAHVTENLAVSRVPPTPLIDEGSDPVGSAD